MTQRSMQMTAVAMAGLVFPTAAFAQTAIKPADLPPAVKKTFDARFPRAKIEKLDAEEENGVMVYDFEFRDGKVERETDIAADGTMLEHTLVIRTKEVPKEAFEPIRAAAKGATMGRTERIELSYELKDGKVVKLAKPETHYAVVLKKDGRSTEICVDEHGKVLEPPQWPKSKVKK